MTTVQGFREFLCDRLTAAALEIFTVFEQTIIHYETEIVRQRQLQQSEMCRQSVCEDEEEEEDPCEDEEPPEESSVSPVLEPSKLPWIKLEPKEQDGGGQEKQQISFITRSGRLTTMPAADGQSDSEEYPCVPQGFPDGAGAVRHQSAASRRPTERRPSRVRALSDTTDFASISQTQRSSQNAPGRRNALETAQQGFCEGKKKRKRCQFCRSSDDVKTSKTCPKCGKFICTKHTHFSCLSCSADAHASGNLMPLNTF